MGKSTERKARRMTKRMLTAAMADMFVEYSDSDITLNKIFQELRLKTHPLKMLAADIIQEMLEDGFIEEGRKGHYRVKVSKDLSDPRDTNGEGSDEDSLIGRQFVGTLKVGRNSAYLLANSHELPADIFIASAPDENRPKHDTDFIEGAEHNDLRWLQRISRSLRAL